MCLKDKNNQKINLRARAMVQWLWTGTLFERSYVRFRGTWWIINMVQNCIENGHNQSKISWNRLNFIILKYLASSFNAGNRIGQVLMIIFGRLGIWIADNSILRPKSPKFTIKPLVNVALAEIPKLSSNMNSNWRCGLLLS